jgi:hypothetical protein
MDLAAALLSTSHDGGVFADLVGNGRADVVMNFPGAGIWVWMNNTSWLQLHPLNAEDLSAGPIGN